MRMRVKPFRDARGSKTSAAAAASSLFCGLPFAPSRFSGRSEVVVEGQPMTRQAGRALTTLGFDPGVREDFD